MILSATSLLPLLGALTIPAQAQTGTIAITGVNVIDVVAGRVVNDRTVTISAGTITAVGAAASVAVPANARIIDGTGFYLMPGLWDMHVHLRGNPVDRDKPLIEENAAMLDLFLVNGVVGVREMGGDLSDHVFDWRDKIKAGKLTGPRILTPGRKLDVASPAWRGMRYGR